MKLYYTPGTCALADHIVLEWIGQPFELERVSREARKSPDYLRINPAGAVPAFEDDGWILTQNAAILNYLADRFPEAKLGGDGSPRGRAEVNRWLAMANSDIHPSFLPMFGGLGWLEDEALVEQGKAAARTKLRTLFERVDAGLEGKDWIAGARSIADPYLYVTLRWAKAQDVDLSGLDRLQDYRARMEADPGVQRALAAEGLA